MDQTKDIRLPGQTNYVWPGSQNRLSKAANFGF
jgi:hypothetical protein